MGTHYSHLSEADRMSIQALLQAKVGCGAIARQLGFSASTVYREVSRGKPAATAGAID